MVSLVAEHRAGAGVRRGDEVEVDLELDNRAPGRWWCRTTWRPALDAEPGGPGALRTGCPTAKPVLARPSGPRGARTEETRLRRIRQVGGGAAAGAGPADRLDHPRNGGRSDRAWRHGPQAAGWAGRVPGAGPGGRPRRRSRPLGDQVLELGGHTGVQGWDDHAPPVHVRRRPRGQWTFRPDPVAVHVARPGRMSLAPMSPSALTPRNESPQPRPRVTPGGRRHHDRHLPATDRRTGSRAAQVVTPTRRGRPGS
jgi:hypothetical protein